MKLHLKVIHIISSLTASQLLLVEERHCTEISEKSQPYTKLE